MTIYFEIQLFKLNCIHEHESITSPVCQVVFVFGLDIDIHFGQWLFREPVFVVFLTNVDSQVGTTGVITSLYEPLINTSTEVAVAHPVYPRWHQ